MNHKKVLKKVARSLPGFRTYIEVAEKEKKDLQQTIKTLEVRNDEWAAEVRMLRRDDKRLEIVWPVLKKDLIAADFEKKKAEKKPLQAPRKPPFHISWVVPPMGKGTGGHVDIFRTINYLESKGHTCNVYFYDPLETSSFEELKQSLQSYPKIAATLFYNTKKIADCDALFATHWYTAYPVFNYQGRAKKYYYVQDFEPFFEPVGSYSTLAENTYKFGFRGLTLGSWLSEKLSKEYGMQCDHFELGTDSNIYSLQNRSKPRKKVLFYSRPVSPRRGFEIGVLALEIFHAAHPEYEINFLGWDMSRYDIPFPFVDKGILSPKDLNRLYNECAAGLVLSFTNMSLLPLEMLSSGCTPVMNDAKHTRMVGYSDKLKYATPTPQSLADALHEAVKNSQKKNHAKDNSSYTNNFKWEASNEKIEQILLTELGNL